MDGEQGTSPNPLQDSDLHTTPHNQWEGYISSRTLLVSNHRGQGHSQAYLQLPLA